MAVPNAPLKNKTAYKKARCIVPLHTSGSVTITPDGTKLITCVGDEAIATVMKTGVEFCRFAGDTQAINSLCVSPSSRHLLLFTASLSLRIYEVPSISISGKAVPPIRVVGRAHDAPVHVCIVEPTSTYLASGSADGVVKVWNILGGFVTHVFKGHGGVVSALTFNCQRDASSVTSRQKMQLITASVDTRIRIFDLTTPVSASGTGAKPLAVLDGHVSVPRGLNVSADGKWLISGGRDSVVLMWDLTSKSDNKKKAHGQVPTPTLAKTIPILERVEAVGFLHPDQLLAGSDSKSDRICFYTGGENGVIKIWDAREETVLFTLGDQRSKDSDDQEEQRQIVGAIYVPSTSMIASVHADQNILCHSLSSGTLTRQFIGYNDEIVDATFISPHSIGSTRPSSADSHIALATNSSLIRIYSTLNFDARLLVGHTDIILSLDHSHNGNVLASGSKDHSARLWAVSPSTEEEEWGWGCVALCEGHAQSVGAVSMSRNAGGDVESGGKDANLKFMFTGSQDRTIKMWDLSAVSILHDGSEPVKCKSLATHKAHEKDINALDVAPNDRFLASGSQDRTAKIYEIEYAVGKSGKSVRGEIKLIGTCKGHKRGVWAVRFGRVERVLATGSGDKTVKLWNLQDFSCVKTFEGHTNSVLRVDFLNAGMQLVSSASDGLVKLWNVREEECIATMDNHEDKVWALAVSTDEQTIVSGAADSIVTFWEDCTEEQEKEKETKRVETALKEQDFRNYIALKDYRRAIELGLSLEQPGRLLSLFKELRSMSSVDEMDTSLPASSITGHPAVDEVIRTLAGSDLAKLLRYVRDWNANGKTSAIAQNVLYAVVKLRPADDVAEAFGEEADEFSVRAGGGFGEGPKKGSRVGGTALRELVDALIPYTERHLSRMEKLVQDSYVVDYILSEMDDGIFDGAPEEEGSLGSGPMWSKA